MEGSSGFAVDVIDGRVRVIGQIDVTTAPLMVEAVMKAMTVELDLSEVTFIDSSGLAGLINLRNSRAPLRIVDVSPNVHRVLECTGLAESLLTYNRTSG